MGFCLAYNLRFFFTLLVFLHVFILKSQDIHFSQYNGSLLNTNPAFTGFFEGDYRTGAIYRSQWQSVPVSYSTFSFFGDTKYTTKKTHQIGLGILFNNDKSGDANYNINQCYASASYIHKINKDSTLVFSGGANIGFSNITFNYNKMTFDNQYDGLHYNPSLNTGESFASNSAYYLDISLGSLFKYIIKQRAYLQYGFSVSHFNSPRITFQNNTAIRLDTKFYNYLSFQYPISKSMDFVFECLQQHQGKFNEYIPSGLLKIHLNESNQQQIGFGLNYRAKDAVILRLFYQIKTLNIGACYDINTSKFMAATNKQGAFEIYLTYIFKKIIPFVPKTRVCPIYM